MWTLRNTLLCQHSRNHCFKFKVDFFFQYSFHTSFQNYYVPIIMLGLRYKKMNKTCFYTHRMHRLGRQGKNKQKETNQKKKKTSAVYLVLWQKHIPLWFQGLEHVRRERYVQTRKQKFIVSRMLDLEEGEGKGK